MVMLLGPVMFGINTVSVGALPPPEGTLALFDAADMDHCVNWTVGSEPGTYPYFYVKVMITNVSQYYNTVFSLKWNPAILDLTTITPGDATYDPTKTMFGPILTEWNHTTGELLEWAYGQLGPDAGSVKTFTDPNWGWVATLKFKFVGTPPAVSHPIDTCINLTYLEPDYKTGWWKLVDYLRRPFTTLVSCHLHYERLIHDVAVTNLDVPAEATVGDLVSINVTVANEGTYNESVSVAASYNEILIDTTVIGVLSPGEFETVSFEWNTASLAPNIYTINATATIASDEEPGDNFKTAPIEINPVVEYPAIYIEPSTTVDPSLTPGKIYTISVKTDYTGDDINSWQFTLSYNPSVLKIGLDGLNYTDIWTGTGTKKSFEAAGKLIVPDSEDVYVGGVLKTKGVDYTIDYQTGMITFTTAPAKGAEVKATYLYTLINGDLITKTKNPNAMFNPGTYDNVGGRLSLTGAFFFYIFPPAPLTSGPGILANVTFTVVGIGESNITLGPETKLIGITEGGMGNPYNIVDGGTMPDHIGHGYFNNIPPSIHDVAITSLDAPTEATIGDIISINMTVTNEGTYNESVTVTVSYDSTDIDTTTFTLNKGLSEAVSFSWNTTGVSPGTYTINATATIASDEEPGDNFKTSLIEIKPVFGFAIIYVEPASTVNMTLTPGKIYTISIKTNYTGDDIRAWQFSLSYNPDVLHGVSVTNGDLVTTDRHPSATFWPGIFNNTEGTLSVTTGFFFFLLEPAPITYGPGTLANVTFTVVGLGESNITLGPVTKLVGYTKNGYGDPYKIVDGEIPEHLRHGYFNNIPPIHDVAVTNITPFRAVVRRGCTVRVNVTIANEGDLVETFPVTLYANTIPARTEVVTLPSGNSTTLTFVWETGGVPYSNYTMIGYAWTVPNETDTLDNTLVDGWVVVTIGGDADGDFDCDADDAFMYVGLAYNSRVGDPNYNPNCDFDCDGDVDTDDVFMYLAPNYGKKV